MAGGVKKNADPALIIALASGQSATEAAKGAGVSPRTVYRRLDDPKFRGVLDKARSLAVERMASVLGEASAEVAHELLKLVREAKTETTKVHAIRLALEFAVKGYEMNFDRRLAALEQKKEQERGREQENDNRKSGLAPQTTRKGDRQTRRNGQSPFSADRGRPDGGNDAGGQAPRSLA